jgi:hypothetical protein
MGVFMGAMGDVSPIQIVNGREVPQAPLREQMRAALKATASKAGGWARNFGVLTALFGGVECVIEKYRAKHDVWNPAVSGCIVGATLAAKGGPGVRHVAQTRARAQHTHTQLVACGVQCTTLPPSCLSASFHFVAPRHDTRPLASDAWGSVASP